MLQTTKTAKNRRYSMFLGNRRKRIVHLAPIAAPNFNFVRDNEGSISASYMEAGIVRCRFQSKKTGKTAFAFGSSFSLAYRHMIRNFNQKYPA